MPDDVVEHRLGGQQQPPVEAHRARRRAARPAGPLAADRQRRVRRFRPVRRRGPAAPSPRPAPPAGTSARCAGRCAPPAGTSSSSPRRCARVRPGCADHPQRLAEVRDRLASRRDRRAGAVELGDAGARSTGAARGSRRPPRARAPAAAARPRRRGRDRRSRARAGRAPSAGSCSRSPSHEARQGTVTRPTCLRSRTSIEPLTDGVVALRPAAERDIPEILIAYQDDPELHLRLGEERPPSGAELGRLAERAASGPRRRARVTLTILEPRLRRLPRAGERPPRRLGQRARRARDLGGAAGPRARAGASALGWSRGCSRPGSSASAADRADNERMLRGRAQACCGFLPRADAARRTCANRRAAEVRVRAVLSLVRRDLAR